MVTEFLECCSEKTRFQCIMTTHNTILMNQNILRRDELWITDKNNGVSSLTSISDYEGLNDRTKIKDLYKEGRFGGIPHIINYKLPEKKYED